MKSVTWIPGLLAATVLLAAWGAPDATGQTPMYMKVNGIDGESADHAHRGWIELTSVSWPTGAEPRSGGPGTVIITKRTDRATPRLMQACASGESLGDVVLSLRERSRAGTATTRRMTLGNVRLSGCRAASQDHPIETISFNFTRIEFDAGAGTAAAGYLRLGNIQGEATDSRYRDWIVLESVSFDRSATSPRGAQPIRLTRRADRSSAALRTAHARQTRFAEATLAVRDDRDPARYVTIKMRDVLVSSYQTGADVDGITLQAVVEVSGL